jgi:hypothetical protein
MVMKPTKKRVENTIKRWAKENEVDISDVTVYSGKEWRERGEDYGNTCPATFVFEGELYEIINGYVCQHIQQSFYDTLLSTFKGWYMERMHSWSIGFYEC